MTATELVPATTGTGTTNRDITHLWCHNPDIALCGTDVSGYPEVANDVPATCVVCAGGPTKPTPPDRRNAWPPEPHPAEPRAATARLSPERTHGRPEGPRTPHGPPSTPHKPATTRRRTK